MITFLRLVATGMIKAEDIDDWIEEWHDTECSVSLAQSLGMSDEDYAAWVEDPDYLAEILKSFRADDDIDEKTFQISHATGADEQESSMANGTLTCVNERAITISMTPPADWHADISNADFNALAEQTFRSLVTAGWDIAIARGPENAIDMADIIEEQAPEDTNP